MSRKKNRMNAPQFRTVRRGFDPAEVEQHFKRAEQLHSQAVDEAASKTAELAKLGSDLEQQRERVVELQQQVERLQHQVDQAASSTASSVDYSGLGERIAQILQLAEDEAKELRAKATRDAEALTEQTRDKVTQQCDEADQYAEEAHSHAIAEASRLVATAKKEADDLMDYADRESSARRREAEALYEQQRAAAAAAAADFEATLASRRQSAADEFAAQMAAHEKSLATAREQLEAAGAEAKRVRAQSAATAKAEMERAEQEARELVENARNQADRVRRESERELAAMASRRDAITDQLTNVRQMLATLGGGSALAALAEQHEAGVPESAGSPAEADEDTEAEDTDAGDTEPEVGESEGKPETE